MHICYFNEGSFIQKMLIQTSFLDLWFDCFHLPSIRDGDSESCAELGKLLNITSKCVSLKIVC